MADKKNDWDLCFSRWLNIIASILILLLIGYFVYQNLNKNKNIKNNYYNKIEVIFSENNKSNYKSKLEEIEKNISQLEKIKNEIRIKEEKRSDDLKYYSTLIGFILAIVGFFGFKSIHDTRLAAIEKAVNDAKNEAIKEAREASKNEAKVASITEARNVAEITSKQVAENAAIKTSKDETLKYLSDEFPKQFRIQEEKYISSFTDELKKVSDDLDKLMNPNAYKQNHNKIKLLEDLENMKTKYNEILEIITNMKIKFLENENRK